MAKIRRKFRFGTCFIYGQGSYTIFFRQWREYAFFSERAVAKKENFESIANLNFFGWYMESKKTKEYENENKFSWLYGSFKTRFLIFPLSKTS